MGRIGEFQVKKEVSLGNLGSMLMMMMMFVAGWVSLQGDVESNKQAIAGGILPGADLRVTTLETTINIIIPAMNQRMENLEGEIRRLRLSLQRTEMPSNKL